MQAKLVMNVKQTAGLINESICVGRKSKNTFQILCALFCRACLPESNLPTFHGLIPGPLAEVSSRAHSADQSSPLVPLHPHNAYKTHQAIFFTV